MSEGVRLEAGTDEMKLLVFKLGGTSFGINVSRVREIIERMKTIKVPYTPPMVEGIFKLRDEVLTLVKLGFHFDMEGEVTARGEGAIIIVEFNQTRYGILVDSVEAIYSLTWEQIEPPSSYLTDMRAPVTGITKINGDTILIADFETITEDVLGIQSANIPDDVDQEPKEKKDVKVLLADDSSVLRTSLTRILKHNGYCDLTICNDGQEAWETLMNNQKEDKTPFDIVISDIEMPRLNGLSLTTKIKEEQSLKDIPVVLFSSLINKENIKIAQDAGADAQVSKPLSGEMIDAVENCLKKRGRLAAV